MTHSMQSFIMYVRLGLFLNSSKTLTITFSLSSVALDSFRWRQTSFESFWLIAAFTHSFERLQRRAQAAFETPNNSLKMELANTLWYSSIKTFPLNGSTFWEDAKVTKLKFKQTKKHVIYFSNTVMIACLPSKDLCILLLD